MRDNEKLITDCSDQLSTMVNSFGFPAEEIAQYYVQNEHPTLQQNFMRLVVAFLQAMANKKYTDARNKASHELAKKLLEGVEPEQLYLPHI